MTDRERLIELMNGKTHTMKFQNSDHWFDFQQKCEELADYILENGVIVPPVKLGDTIYEIMLPKNRESYFVSGTVCALHLGDGSRNHCNHKRESYIIAEFPNTRYVCKYPLSKIGISIFTSLEDVEKALKERKQNDR